LPLANAIADDAHDFSKGCLSAKAGA